MPRHRRLEIPGGIYHVITRGIERREIFKDDDDRKEFLRRFEVGLRETESKCYGWVLMPNHFHLLVVIGKRSLSTLMRKVLTGYAIYFNRRYKRSGYLYQNRYKSILCQEESYLLELTRYIHLNPIRGGIVNSITELNKYKWSGHSILAGYDKNTWQSTDEILERFGDKRADAVKKYIEFVEDGLNMGRRYDLTGGGLKRSVGGWQGLLELRRNKEYWRADERILGDGDFVDRVLKISDEEMLKRDKLLRAGWNIYRVVEKTCKIIGVKKEDIHKRSRGNKISQARSLIAYWGYQELGIKGSELAKYFGITRQSIGEAIKRGEQVAKDNRFNLIT